MNKLSKMLLLVCVMQMYSLYAMDPSKESGQEMTQEEIERCRTIIRNFHREQETQFRENFNAARQLVSWNITPAQQEEYEKFRALNAPHCTPQATSNSTRTIGFQIIAFVQSWINNLRSAR